MPYYLYQSPKTGKIVEIFQHMNDIHEYSENNEKFERIFLSPNTSIDTVIDPYNSKDFIKVTNKKGGTIGELWERSGELSEKRKDKDGVDFIKDNTIKSYEKSVKKPHAETIKQRAKKNLEKLGVVVET